jgi:hypothetical protein
VPVAVMRKHNESPKWLARNISVVRFPAQRPVGPTEHLVNDTGQPTAEVTS